MLSFFCFACISMHHHAIAMDHAEHRSCRRSLQFGRWMLGESLVWCSIRLASSAPGHCIEVDRYASLRHVNARALQLISDTLRRETSQQRLRSSFRNEVVLGILRPSLPRYSLSTVAQTSVSITEIVLHCQ
ncbi:hypothetical protein OE88DRAFT_1320435 [Heliocybe sulcata]|uniref:Secreted protein n=1 Tax=Heliocybe sulcata TaxID=5364 RepID=A0A5C3N5L8_9AGAM|nr:hypothetical protein OE88DRAFT_1320435 [Heliocybe sulcata]